MKLVCSFVWHNCEMKVCLAVALESRHSTERGDCNLLPPQLLKWMDGVFGSIKFLLCREGKESNLAGVCIPHC